LDLTTTRVTDAGVAELQEALPKLKISRHPGGLAIPQPRD
jgi:hypothetical protein